MSHAARLAIGLFAVLGPVAAASEPPPVPSDHPEAMREGLALFSERIRPVLIAQCLDCHGGKATKGDLDLSDRDTLLKSGVLEGGGAASRFRALIAHEEEPKMPQKGARLDDATIADITRWIDLGAPYDRPLVDRAAVAATKRPGPTAEDRNFWAFQRLTHPTPPSGDGGEWSKSPIDRFLLVKLQEHGLVPNPPADRRALIRRLTFDLIGLALEPADVEAFVVDPAPDAYERLVDRLLASPQYGERWARHWMDVARFAESHGYEQDYDRPFAFHYRDFLIRALNQDLPYDQFVRWQIAGDELAPNNAMAMAATGFLGAGAFPTQLTEMEFESARYEELNDMTATTGSAFLGLSIGCARCHDHKYDPIPAEDYYRFASAFTSTIRAEVDLPDSPGGGPARVQVTAEGYPHTKHHADDRGFPHFYPQTFVLSRGDVHQKKQEATLGFLGVLTPETLDAGAWKVESTAGNSRSSYRRAALAGWLTDVDRGAGALAARVIVNRLWQHHFGRGIVATPNDFGAQGDRPTHPELLDWLAGELIRGGWRLKPLHRAMVLSAAYRQGDQFDEARATVDREETFLWRRAPRRLEAEAIRDAMFQVSGLLDGRQYGPGTLDPGMPRRSVYFFIKRSQLIPSMMLFDWPEHLVSIGRRGSTTTASQALLFLNSPEARRCAEAFAGRLESTPDDQVAALAYQLALGRAPSEAERAEVAEFLQRQQASYQQGGNAAPRRAALADFSQALLGSSEFLFLP